MVVEILLKDFQVPYVYLYVCMYVRMRLYLFLVGIMLVCDSFFIIDVCCSSHSEQSCICHEIALVILLAMNIL